MRILISSIAIYWSIVFLWGFNVRALDSGDPFLYAINALSALDAFNKDSILGWFGSVMNDVTGKPGVKALLSLALLMGAKHSVSLYYWVMGISCILFWIIAAIAICRLRNLREAIIFSVLGIASNLMLAHLYGGTHNWPGQVLLWTAIFISTQQNTRNINILFGAFLALSAITTPHMFPFVASVFMAKHFWQWLRKEFKPTAFSLIGLIGIPALLSLLAAPKAGSSYFGKLWERATMSSQESVGQYALGHDFLPRLLWLSESTIFVAVLALFAAYGIYHMALKLQAYWQKKYGNEPYAATLLVLVPVFSYLYLEFSGFPQLGRSYLPLIPFLFALAGVGGVESVTKVTKAYKADNVKKKFSPLYTLCALSALVTLLAFCWIRQQPTRDAFHAGNAIRAITGSDRVITVGLHHPFFYLNEGPRRHLDPQRIKRMEDNLYSYRHDISQRALNIINVFKNFKTGNEWVLLSYFSSWNWDSFIEDWSNTAFPAKKIYESPLPYKTVPGVEATPYQLFHNVAFNHKARKGDIPFPAENRLYRASDLLKLYGVK